MLRPAPLYPPNARKAPLRATSGSLDVDKSHRQQTRRQSEALTFGLGSGTGEWVVAQAKADKGMAHWVSLCTPPMKYRSIDAEKGQGLHCR